MFSNEIGVALNSFTGYFTTDSFSTSNAFGTFIVNQILEVSERKNSKSIFKP